MLKAALQLHPDYYLYYVAKEEGVTVACGGIDKGMTFRYEKADPMAMPESIRKKWEKENAKYAELILRATVALVYDGPFDKVFADESFGFDLTPYGFTKTETGYEGERENLRLPHFCGGH